MLALNMKDLEEILILLEEFAEKKKDESLLTEIYLISGRHRGLQKEIHRGVLSSNEQELKKNKLRSSILELIDLI